MHIGANNYSPLLGVCVYHIFFHKTFDIAYFILNIRHTDTKCQTIVLQYTRIRSMSRGTVLIALGLDRDGKSMLLDWMGCDCESCSS